MNFLTLCLGKKEGKKQKRFLIAKISFGAEICTPCESDNEDQKSTINEITEVEYPQVKRRGKKVQNPDVNIKLDIKIINQSRKTTINTISNINCIDRAGTLEPHQRGNKTRRKTSHQISRDHRPSVIDRALTTNGGGQSRRLGKESRRNTLGT